MKRFKIEFSGKGYPPFRPISVTVAATDKKRAEEWVEKQLRHWKLEDADVKFVIKDAPPLVLLEEDDDGDSEK